MIVLGVDPGSRKTGYGVVRKDGNRFEHLENGTLYLEKEKSYPARLVTLHNELKRLIVEYNVTELSVENIFYYKNPKSINI